MSHLVFCLSILILAGRVSASPSYDYVSSARQILLAQESLLAGCQDLLRGYKHCHYRLPNAGHLGNHVIEDVYQGSSDTGIIVDRVFKGIDDDLRIAINDMEIPIPDGDGAFFVPLPVNEGPNFTLQLVNQFAGIQTFDRDAEALIRSVTLVKSNSHYIQQILSKLPELGSQVEIAKQTYLQVKRNLRFVTLTKESAAVYLSSILGRDPHDLSGHCLEPVPLEPEECGVLAIIVSILKGETPGITPDDKQKALADFARSTADLGQALNTLRAAQREYSDTYRQAYAEAYRLVIQESPQ